MEHAGFLGRILRPVVKKAHTDGQLIAAAGLTAVGLNVVAGDQYVADVMPSRAYREGSPDAVSRRGCSRARSRTPAPSRRRLVPWNSCGAYMTGVLGVPTMEYLPFAFFNLVNPIIAIVFGFTGFHVEHQQSRDPVSGIEVDALGAPPANVFSPERDAGDSG